ncbi:hypothetical protein Bbelb_307330 [Branchiostoma belcheri]|nr:hypothetical protein Bbelb_307330 [Branchiostoma belcheri]
MGVNRVRESAQGANYHKYREEQTSLYSGRFTAVESQTSREEQTSIYPGKFTAVESQTSWKMSEVNMTSLADKLQNIELCLKNQRNPELGFGQALREAIVNNDPCVELEVLKSLGDLRLEKAKLSKDSAEFDKAASLYAAALPRCKDPDIGETLEHRISYMEKLSRQLLQGYSPQYQSPDYWGTADSHVLRVAKICDKLDRRVGKPWHSVEEIYTETLVTAITNGDGFLEVEVLKSLGDFHLKKGQTTSDVSQFSKAAAMYNKALTTCGDPGTKLTLEHRIKYMEKIRKAVKRKPSLKKSRPKEGRPGLGHQSANITRTDIIKNQHPHPDRTSKTTDQEMAGVVAGTFEDDKGLPYREYRKHFKQGDSSLARSDLDSAEQHFAAALKTVHVRDATAQQYQREVEPLCKLGDVYSKRGQQTGDGGDFVKAAALYNAAIARTEDQVLNGNIATAIIEVEKSFIKCILDISHNVSLDNTEKHKKQLKEMRDQIKLEMETIDQQLDPYVHDEDDPCVRKIEAKRAQAVRQLFEKIAQQRKEFIILLVEECIGLMGSPPCKYALMGLGSQATGLVTPYSDLEFAILVEDESEQYKGYFRNLTHYLHLKVVNLGETILPALGIKSLNDFYSENPLDNWYYDSVTPRGFAFDGSMPKASKTPLGRQGTKNKPPSELIHTPSNMLSILKNDVTVYLKKGYHLATVLRNPCLIAGDQDLIDKYMAITEKILQADGGSSWQHLGEYKTAISYHEQALQTQRSIYGLDEAHPDIAKSLNSLGMACHALGDHRKSTSYLEQALQMCRTIHGQGTKHHHIATILSHLGLAFFSLGDARKAISYHEQALQMYRSVHGPNVDHPDIARALNILGQTWTDLLDNRKATDYLEEALQMRKRIYGDSTAHPDIAISINNLGIAYQDLGDYQRAVSYHEQALAMRRSIYGQTAENPHIARSLNNLGSTWSRLKNYSKAKSYLEQALQMRRSIYGQDAKHPDIHVSLINFVDVWNALGDHVKAIHYSEQALQMIKFLHGQDTVHVKIAITLAFLGEAWSSAGDPRKAIGYHTEALQMYRIIYDQDTSHPRIEACLNNISVDRSKLGDH